jgi:hypothetical protein
MRFLRLAEQKRTIVGKSVSERRQLRIGASLLAAETREREPTSTREQCPRPRQGATGTTFVSVNT